MIFVASKAAGSDSELWTFEGTTLRPFATIDVLCDMHAPSSQLWHVMTCYDLIRCQKHECPMVRRWINRSLAGSQIRTILARCHSSCHMLSTTSLESSKSGRQALLLGRLNFRDQLAWLLEGQDCAACIRAWLLYISESEVYRSAMFVMLTHVDSCWLMLTHVDSCWLMLTHVDSCWLMLAHVGSCWLMTSL